MGDAAGEWVPAECGAVVACFDVLACRLLRNEGGADWDAVSEGFGCGEDVWVWGFTGKGEGGLGVGPEGACAGETALDFVVDEDCADSVAAFAEGGEEFRGCGVDASFALDGFYDYTAGFICD